MPGLMYLRKKVMIVQIGLIGGLIFEMKVRSYETSFWSAHRWLPPYVCVILNKIYPVFTPCQDHPNRRPHRNLGRPGC